MSKASITLIPISKLLPESLFFQMNNLFKRSLLDEYSKEKAREVIDNSKKARENLLGKLELILERIENWHYNSTQNKHHKKTKLSQSLLLKAQAIADQINSLESVEAQITNLLSKKDSKN